MSPNIPGAGNLLPGVVTEISTLSRGASVPQGIRVPAIIGLGERPETIVASALGNGADGLNSSYSSTIGADGRHFMLSLAPIIQGRTTLYKNNIPLTGLEAAITSGSFSNLYDYRIDPDTGKIELQTSRLVDLGGSFYTAGVTNVGQGTISNLVLSSTNAPTETWTIKCIDVAKDSGGSPIAGTAKFLAFGSVSGNVLDGYGNPVLWMANSTLNTNGILTFSIGETGYPSSTSPFRPGDSFTVKVYGGVLKQGDTLTATYIAESDINSPLTINNMNDAQLNHGVVSADNTLSLGCQLAFSNQAPAVITLQVPPPLPRRQSFDLFDINATSTDGYEFILPLPVGITPDINSDIHFFVTDPTTGVETQLVPNKYDFYTIDTVGHPTSSQFIFSDTNPPSGYAYSYSVVSKASVINYQIDGYINASQTASDTCTFSSTSITFTSDYVGKQIRIEDPTNAINAGTFDITAVSGGALTVETNASPPFADFTNGSSVAFRVINTLDGTVVASTTGADGVLTAIGGSATATFTSAGINFNLVSSPTIVNNAYRLEITAGVNKGKYRITNYSSGPNQLTIAKTFLSESDVKFEIIDSSENSNFIVINHNIVPNNNTLRVTLVTDKDALFYDAGWVTALETLETVECDIVVPLPNNMFSAVFQNTLAHCRVMSNIRNKKERVLFTGAISGLTPDNLIGNSTAAVEDVGILEGIQGDSIAEILAGNTEDITNYKISDNFGDTFRCVYFWPDEIITQVGTSNATIDGFYIAAAAAGWCAAQPNIAVPLTNKVLSGFTISNTKKLAPNTLSDLAFAGATVLQPVAGGGKVIWGRTTTNSGFAEEEEISIVFIRDRIAKSLRTGFEGFIGIPEDDNTQNALSGRANSLFTSFISQKLITDFRDIIVKRDDVDPRQWNIVARVQPVYPVNYIYIKVSIGLL